MVVPNALAGTTGTRTAFLDLPAGTESTTVPTQVVTAQYLDAVASDPSAAMQLDLRQGVWTFDEAGGTQMRVVRSDQNPRYADPAATLIWYSGPGVFEAYGTIFSAVGEPVWTCFEGIFTRGATISDAPVSLSRKADTPNGLPPAGLVLDGQGGYFVSVDGDSYIYRFSPQASPAYVPVVQMPDGSFPRVIHEAPDGSFYVLAFQFATSQPGDSNVAPNRSWRGTPSYKVFRFLPDGAGGLTYDYTPVATF